MSFAPVYPLLMAVGAAVGGAVGMATRKLNDALNDRQYMHEQPLFIQEDFGVWWAQQLKDYSITKGAAALPGSSSSEPTSIASG